MRQELAESKLPHLYGFLDNLAGKHTHAAKNELTIADLAIYNQLYWLKTGMLDGVPSTLPNQFDNLTRVYNTVATHPKVKEWNARHSQ
jgi:glutathione S-transferase